MVLGWTNLAMICICIDLRKKYIFYMFSGIISCKGKLAICIHLLVRVWKLKWDFSCKGTCLCERQRYTDSKKLNVCYAGAAQKRWEAKTEISKGWTHVYQRFDCIMLTTSTKNDKYFKILWCIPFNISLSCIFVLHVYKFVGCVWDVVTAV